MSLASDPLRGSDLTPFLNQIPAWELDRAETAITRTLYFSDFKAAFEFMTEVASFAELLDHHPEWCNSWNRVELKLATHTAHGLTRADFELAGYIDRLLLNFALICPTDEASCSGCR